MLLLPVEPSKIGQFLERRLAYRLQEAEFRKVDVNLLDRNQRRIAALVETGKVKKRDRDYRPAAGTAALSRPLMASTTFRGGCTRAFR